MTFKEHQINKENNFIGGWYMSPDLCDAILDKAKSIPGFFRWPYSDYYVNNYLSQLDNSLFTEYVEQLNKVCSLYVDKYKFCSQNVKFRLTTFKDVPEEIINNANDPLLKFQKYYPGKSYYNYHSEFDGITAGVIKRRHLATMTYLNDITDAGGTEFYYQNFTCKPEKGLTLIWPVQWTHTHKGIPSLTEYKYIITGWYVFDENLKKNGFEVQE
jgi:hypothetical protein